MIAAADEAPGRSIRLKLGYNDGQGGGVQFAEGIFWLPLPAPSAAAVLGLAGLAGRRRR